MNRLERRIHNKEMKSLPAKLTKVDKGEWPDKSSKKRIDVWRSRNWLVQAFEEDNGMVRLSISSVRLGTRGWADGISWDDLQKIKSEVGYGDYDAVEIYPRDCHVVNVANMRHLWIAPGEIPFKWKP